MAFERCVADLEGGTQGFAFASGLAAIATVLECSTRAATSSRSTTVRRQVPAVRARAQALRRARLQYRRSHRRRARSRRRSGPNTRMIWVETPTNPLLKLVDLERVAAIAQARGI